MRNFFAFTFILSLTGCANLPTTYEELAAKENRVSTASATAAVPLSTAYRNLAVKVNQCWVVGIGGNLFSFSYPYEPETGLARLTVQTGAGLTHESIMFAYVDIKPKGDKETIIEAKALHYLGWPGMPDFQEWAEGKEPRCFKRPVETASQY